MKKTVVLIAILLLVLLAGLEFYAQTEAFGRKIRPFAVGPLKETLGVDAEIGRVKANFIPPSLEVRDIVVRGADGKPVVAIRKIKAYINPIPLLLRKVRLPLISILEPRLYAERSKDGATNLAPLMGRISAYAQRPAPEGAPGYSLLLRKLSLKQGRIEYHDQAASVKLSLTELNMSLKVDLSQERFLADLTGVKVRLATPAYPELSGTLTAAAEYDRGRVRIDAAEFSTADAVIAVTGVAGTFSEAPLDLKVRAGSGPRTIGRYLDFLKPAGKREGSRFDVQAAVRGKLSDPVVEGSLSMTGVPFGAYLLRDGALSFAYRNRNLTMTGGRWLLARGDEKLAIDSVEAAVGYAQGGLDLGRLEVVAGDLALHCTGRVDPATGFDVPVLAVSSGKGLTLSLLAGVPMEGSVNATGRLTGALASPRFFGSLSAGPVVVRGVHFKTVSGGFEYAGQKARLSAVKIAEPSSRYVFDGEADFSGKETLYTARLQVLHSTVVNIVALFYEQLPLNLSAVGELNFQGTGSAYSGSGFLKLDAGSAYGESFVRGVVTASLTTGRIAFPQVALYKEKGVLKGTGWIGFDGSYSADLDSKGIDVSAVDRLNAGPFGGEAKLEIHSSGSFSYPSVKASLEVEELRLHTVPLGAMRAEAVIRDGALTFNANVSPDLADLSLRLKLDKPYSWLAEARVRAEAVDPALLTGNKTLAELIKVSVDGAVTLQGQGLEVSSLSGEAAFPRISFGIGDYRIGNESEVGFSIRGGNVAIKASHFAGPGTRIGVSGSAGPAGWLDITLAGAANLSLLKLLNREVEQAAGFADVKLAIKSEGKDADVAGELLLRDGEIKIRDIPQRFTALRGKINLAQGRIVTESLSGEMGGGTLNASGWAQLSGAKLGEFSAKASLDNITVRYPEGLTSTLSGELYFDGDASEQALTGDVTIKRARYDKRVEWKSMLVDFGKGLYQKKKAEVGWIGETLINVRFHGSDNIVFQNNLAAMQLGADVFLQGTVNHPLFLGRIEARKGVVYFRKNEFKILHASADFVDPSRMNPVLDIEAETRVREYQIRLAITGTAERAVIAFISEPSLGDTDILSLLALGKKGSELKGKEAGVGMGEAASFATGQFQDVFERRARSFTGFDRFQVDPYVGESDTSVPRVTVGKELIENELYVTFSSNVGAPAPEQLFRIEYLLDRHFTLQGERSETGNLGADLKYRFEFK